MRFIVVSTFSCEEKSMSAVCFVACHGKLQVFEPGFCHQGFGTLTCGVDFVCLEQFMKCDFYRSGWRGGGIFLCGIVSGNVLHGKIACGLPVAKHDSGTKIGFCAGVGKVYEPRVADIGAIDVLSDVFNQIIAVYIDLSAGGTVKNFETFKQTSASMSPVRRTFVAASVFGISVYKFIDRDHGFMYVFYAFGWIAFHQKDTLQHVVVYPRVPVVHRTSVETHPPEVVARVIGC